MPTFDRRPAALRHLHTGVYATAAHTHELDELDATGITDGYVLTADGANGAAWEAASGGGLFYQPRVKTSDTVKDTTSDTTLVSETDFNVTISSAGLYIIEGHMFHTQSVAAPSHQFKIDYTGTISAIRLWTKMYDNSSTRSWLFWTSAGPNTHAWTGANEPHIFHIYGYVNLSTTGTLGYSWANLNTSASQTVTMYAGSHWTIKANV